MLATDFIYADIINEQQANKVAVTFLESQTSTNSLKAILHYKKVDQDGTVAFYVFNFLSYQGFVIVTGDDNIEPVIAYSTKSSFDISIAGNIGVSDWMNDVNEQVKSIKKQNLKADTRISNLWTEYLSGTYIPNMQSASVGPLLTTTWGQSKSGYPSYNSLCPFDTAASNQHCPAGCLATAMAQIMKYWNYPAHGSGSHGYSDNHGYQSANFGGTTYNWAQMPNVLTSTSTIDVDLLMYHCGVAVDMDYEANESGAFVYNFIYQDAEDGFVDYFNYSSSMYFMSRSYYEQSYGINSWISLLKSELDENRPILYRGEGSAGGHAWVCDGYNALDQFWMNWGWNGANNGFFSLSNLNPGNYAFNNDQGALLGIRPANLSACDSHWTLTGNQQNDYTWQASDYIHSNMNIYAGKNAAYTAQNQIILTPGFVVNQNAKFSAKIQPCITPRFGENISSDATEKVNDNNLSVYPNPFSNNVTIEFDLTKDDETTIKLFDLMGKELKTISKSFFAQGKHDITTDASELQAGIYFIVLQGSDFRKEQKIIKVN